MPLTPGAAPPPLPSPKERRRLREARLLTVEALAGQVGVTAATVRRWETGRQTPSGRRREVYARVLARLADPPDAPAPERTPQPAPEPAPEQAAEPAPGPPEEAAPEASPAPAAPAPPSKPAPTPAEAFDALCARTGPALLRQAYLLTGRRAAAHDVVERAFHLAWQRWPEVAVDPDPGSWVRAACHEYALSPWPRPFRAREAPPARAEGRALLAALLALPPSYRRALLLHDGVGVGVPETAAETEATTAATANRVGHARQAVAEALPALADPAELHAALVRLADGERLEPRPPAAVRTGAERRAGLRTGAALTFTGVILALTGLTLATAPTHHVWPTAPGTPIEGVPALSGPPALGRPAPGPRPEDPYRLAPRAG
ncbi:helix-turn-helix domain-containing protein [Streptomyces sp. NPDC050560]|uniref:helix-turn-helix domain-containing protein n=1 Tax=Streptomyces sp. NPDC050560 TaxID=3365630 RepID=UPI0037A77651